MKLWNTEARKKEEVIPKEGKSLTLYTCGPTVYNYAHIGNFRTYLVEDLLCRTLRWMGFSLRHVMNITDVEDKTIRGALESGLSLKEFTEKYTEIFFQDITTLNIEKADVYPRATAYIPAMIQMIETLLEKGIAYVGKDQSIYYAISKFPSYGRLSHLSLLDLKPGASNRVVADEYDKEGAADFVLWKAYDIERDGPFFWESPFGKGRPGWHIECSAMATTLLGPSIDIHAGGVDNLFPHHENEIAQTEGCTCKPFVRYWLHVEHLLVEGRKMSKSLGNFFTLKDLLSQGFSGREIRYHLLSVHYRMQLNFTVEGLEGSKKALMRVDAFLMRMKELSAKESVVSIGERLSYYDSAFKNSLQDDLNISQALASLYDLIREFNGLADQGVLSSQDGMKILQLLEGWDCVLGFIFFNKGEEIFPEEISRLIEARKQARAEKNWSESDRIRIELEKKGFRVEDTKVAMRVTRI